MMVKMKDLQRYSYLWCRLKAVKGFRKSCGTACTFLRSVIFVSNDDRAVSILVLTPLNAKQAKSETRLLLSLPLAPYIPSSYGKEQQHMHSPNWKWFFFYLFFYQISNLERLLGEAIINGTQISLWEQIQNRHISAQM